MCGICGVVDWTESPDAASLVRHMTPTMVHRGPDDEGYLSNGRLALGMRRLSIIDVEGGHQPIFNEDGTVGVVLNGEIYNFRELGRQLKDRGHTFRTRADSEVVAHAYEEWGADCVEHFEGMFALAVWDGRAKGKEQSAKSEPQHDGGRGSGEEQSETLFLARDRLGIKPLYYAAISRQQTADSQYFLFASEVRTLLASAVVPRRLSIAALESYLVFGSVCEPMTLVEGVFSLPPGHRMTIDLGSYLPALHPERYWTVTDHTSNGHTVSGDFKGSANRVRSLLEESVRKQLVADVPIGVFLSGGIDSSSLAALACKGVSDLHTFTVAFPEKEFNEAAAAQRTAKQLGTKHKEVMIGAGQMLARLSDAVSALDQPSIDGINTYFVSWSARQAGLKVALSGLGGDEVFGGYDTFSRTAHYQRIAGIGRSIPRRLRSTMAATMAEAGGNVIRGDAARKIAALWNNSESLPDPFYFGRALFTTAQISELLIAEKANVAPALWWHWLSDSAKRARTLDPFGAVSCMEAQSYLVNTLLRDSDSMSMAHSLEIRFPFLEHSLVEFVTQLPQEMKLRRGIPKALLAAALEDLLPAEILRQPKRGFAFPWAAWLRGPLKASIDNGFAEWSPALQESLDSAHARGIWRSYLDGKTSWSRPWSLYVLNEWAKQHLNQ